MAEVTIKVLKNGPFLVVGPVQLVDATDAEFRLEGQKNPKNIALCRCTQSKNSPFCDGTHKACGFQADETAG